MPKIDTDRVGETQLLNASILNRGAYNICLNMLFYHVTAIMFWDIRLLKVALDVYSYVTEWFLWAWDTISFK